MKQHQLTFKIAIGNFISHEWQWVDEKGNFVTPEIVNQWDRHQMAVQYFKWHNNDCASDIGGPQNKERFLNEVATKIDELIPARFFVKYHQYNTDTYSTKDGTVLKTYFRGSDEHEETKGLVPQFESSIAVSTHDFRPTIATNKQVEFLSHLASEAGYEAIIALESLSFIKASELISFLIGNGEEPKDLFHYLQYV